MGKITAKQIFIGILLAAFLLRFPHFFISLAYDEIWTVNNFIQLPVGRLFFDLSLPNNQPLNSVLVKWMYALPLETEFIRLPSLLAGLISVVLAGHLAGRMAGKGAALWSMFFAAFNAPLIVYNTQARGYSLQIMFLLVFACSLLKVVENHRAGKRAGIAVCSMILSAAAAVLTLPTSVLYLAGITMILWNYGGWKSIPRKSVLFLLASALICFVYILLNLSDLMAARKWGEAVNSVPGYFCWLGGVLYSVLPGTLLPFAIYYLAKFRQYIAGYALLGGLLFVSAIFTNGGPDRVYLPLSMLFCIISGAGVAAIQEKIVSVKYRQLVMLAAMMLTAAAYFYQIKTWRFINYYKIIVRLDELPQNLLVAYPAGDSYSVHLNSKGKAADFYAANFVSNGNWQEIVIVNSPGVINGADRHYNEKTLPLTLDSAVGDFAGITAQRLQLQRIYGSVSDNSLPLIAAFSSMDKQTFKEFRELVYDSDGSAEKVLQLNCWFTAAGKKDGKKIYCGTWYIAPGAMSLESLKNIQESGVLYYLQK